MLESILSPAHSTIPLILLPSFHFFFLKKAEGAHLAIVRAMCWQGMGSTCGGETFCPHPQKKRK